MTTIQQTGNATARDLGKHFLGAGLFALVAALVLMGLVALFGARGMVLWIIAGHQLVANTVMLGWLSYAAGDEPESDAESS